MNKIRWVLVLASLAAVFMISMAFIFASGTITGPRILDSASTQIRETPTVSEPKAEPNLDWVRGTLRANSTADSQSRLASVANSHPAHLAELIRDNSLELYAQTRGAQALVKGVSDENLRVLSPLLIQPVHVAIKKTLLEGLAGRDARPVKSEILSVVKEYSGDVREGREVTELALRVWAAMPVPDGDAAQTLLKCVERARESRPRMRDLLEMVEESSTADPVLVAGAVDLIVAQLPETTTDEINSKNRFVAELMMDSSDAAATVLESIAMGTSGRHSRSQAIYALGNKPCRRNGEILLRVIQKSPDLQLASEAAYALRLVKDLLPESGLSALKTSMNEGLAELSITLAASLLEASGRHQRSHEFVGTALEVGTRFKGTGGPRERDLKLHLAEYHSDPVKTLNELYPAIKWRILNCLAVENSHVPGMSELLLIVFRDKETPESRRVHAATLLGKAGAFAKVSDAVFELLEGGPNSTDWTDWAKVVTSFGSAKEKDRLNELIHSLPQGAKRRMLERGAAD